MASRFNWGIPGLALILALALTILPAAPAWAQDSGAQYVVQPGDSLYSIALVFGTTVDAIQAANNLTDPNSLFIGQSLLIPGLEGVNGVLDFHMVEAGETFRSLPLRFGLSSEAMVKLNRLVNPSQLYIGEPVLVPESLGAAALKGRMRFVGPGDTLVGIAASSGLSPWVLLITNTLEASAGLAIPGQTVVVPGGEGALTALPAPIVGLKLQPLPPAQGKTASIVLQTEPGALVTGVLGDYELHFVEEAGTYRALQGVPALAEPNLYPLVVNVVDSAGRRVSFSQTVNVRFGGYGSEAPLSVDPDLIDPAVVDPEFEQVLGIVRPVTADRYWEGLFQPPSLGRVTSFFGTRRSYNGSGYDYFHSGVDFRGGTGEPIYAPAPGVVVFAGELKVRGNATLIDHGWGVYSGYWHQSRLEVSVGERVETGQEIGRVGATGRVTGPHLHWEVWVGGVQVDPSQWTEVVFP